MCASFQELKEQLRPISTFQPTWRHAHSDFVRGLQTSVRSLFAGLRSGSNLPHDVILDSAWHLGHCRSSPCTNPSRELRQVVVFPMIPPNSQAPRPQLGLRRPFPTASRAHPDRRGEVGCSHWGQEEPVPSLVLKRSQRRLFFHVSHVHMFSVHPRSA